MPFLFKSKRNNAGLNDVARTRSSTVIGLVTHASSSPPSTDPLRIRKPSLEKKVIPQDGEDARCQGDSYCESISYSRDNFRDELYTESKGDNAVERERLRAWDPVLNGDLSTTKAESSSKLLFLIRKGVPDAMRSQVWKAVSGVSDFLEANPTFFKSMVMLVFGLKVPSTVRNVPSFGGVVSPSDHYLADDGKASIVFNVLLLKPLVLKRVLNIVAMSFPGIEVCPALPDVALVCLMFLSEADTCSMLHVMLEHTKANPRYYFNTSVREVAQFTLTFDRLISRHLWSLHKHICDLQIDAAKDIAEPWFSRLFVSSLPYQTMLRVFDVYVNEGSKILYKVGLAVLSLESESLMTTTNKRDFMAALHDIAQSLTDADLLIKTAYRFRMKNHIRRLDTKANLIINSVTEPSMPIYYRPKTPLRSSTIQDEMFEVLWSWLPRRFCIQDPVLIFSTDVHGCSLSTFYHMCSRVAPSVIAIRTQLGSIFGAYVSDPWMIGNTPKPVYYGDGECFIFSLAPTTHCWPWTGENEYFMMAASDHIAVGGGTSCALWLNESFDFCMSSASETFGNPPLEPTSEFLGPVIVEVFGFQ